VSKVQTFYDHHAARCAPDDFWGQIKRSVGGKPVGEDQIAMIVDAIRDGLMLRVGDVLLDLCCGNGALSDRIFDLCQGGVGVDFSRVLIEIAHKNFERPPQRRYLCDDAVKFALETQGARCFTKALCYGSFQYLTARDAERLLRTLGERFAKVGRLFIGNLPDRALIREFYGDRYVPGVEADNESPLGIWRTVDEFSDLARRAGWRMNARRMPAAFYSAHYRYDAVLTPAE
jgi:SAM-dependent methyltransferase